MKITDNQNYFQLFDTQPSYVQDLHQLKQRWYQLQKQFHPDNFALATEAERQAAQAKAAFVNTAYKTLISPVQRAVYLLKQWGIDVQNESDTQMPADFLLLQMEWRERMMDGENINAEVLDAFKACENELMDALKTPLDKEKARLAVRKMMFYEKLNHA